MASVGVIDYQTGNSQSFLYALDRIGVDGRLVSSPRECEGLSHLVLPGVGAAGVTMQSLREDGWVGYLTDTVLGEGLPFLGVCVGLQVLLEESEEGDVECLGWFPGTVKRFVGEGLRVPHMGWNSVYASEAGKRSGRFAELFGPGGYFYFVNSYYAECSAPDDVLGTTDYGAPFASVIGHKNVLATQFHVEKSGQAGLAVLRRFIDADTKAWD